MESEKDKIKLLMVDDETEFLESTAVALKRRGLDVSTAGSGAEAMVMISQSDFDIVLLDVKMPGMDGVEVLERIASVKPGLPVIMLTGHGNIEDAFKSSKIGVVDFLSKPYDMDYLAEKIRDTVKKAVIMKAASESKHESAAGEINVLLVDDEEELLSSLAPALKRRGFSVDTAENGHDALEKVSARNYDVVVLDVKMPGVDGIETLKRMREKGKNFEVLMLTGHPNVNSAFESMKSGAADYIMKPPDVDELTSAIKKLYSKKNLTEIDQGKQIVRDILEKYPE